MELHTTNEMNNQVNNALDFTLASLVANFNTRHSAMENITAFSKETLTDITRTSAIPYVTVMLNDEIIVSKHRAYSFIENDVFEMVRVEDCDEMVDEIMFYVNTAITTMKHFKRDVTEEICQRLGTKDLSEEVRNQIDHDLSFNISTFSKSMIATFTRLALMRRDQCYTDAFYQNQVLKIKIDTVKQEDGNVKFVANYF